MLDLMRDIRRALSEGQFGAFRENFLARYHVADAQARAAKPRGLSA